MSSQAIVTSWNGNLARTLRDAGDRPDVFADEHAANIVSITDEGAPSGSGSPKTTTWTQTVGRVSFTHEVITYQNSGESEQAWQARHDNAVTAAQMEFPPDR